MATGYCVGRCSSKALAVFVTYTKLLVFYNSLMGPLKIPTATTIATALWGAFLSARDCPKDLTWINYLNLLIVMRRCLSLGITSLTTIII